MLSTPYHRHHWAVVPAGGDGEQLKQLTNLISGEPRPKQFCHFFGGRSLLPHTRERIAPILRTDRTSFALIRTHERHYCNKLDDVDGQRQVIQPSNRGTAVAIALSLRRILREDTDARVTFFPSGHHYLDSARFQETMCRGLDTVEQHAGSALLVGARPAYAEVEYGWIEPGHTLTHSRLHRVRRVSRFWEKPERCKAATLLKQGCLWNTFVIMGRAGMFQKLPSETLPAITKVFQREGWSENLEQIYDAAPSVDFSKAVLARIPRRLLVIDDGASGWTDLGTPRRLIDALARAANHLPGCRETRGRKSIESVNRRNRLAPLHPRGPIGRRKETERARSRYGGIPNPGDVIRIPCS